MYIKVVSSKARSNPVNCDISPNFISITKNLDNNIKKYAWYISIERPTIRSVFKFRHISFQDMQCSFKSLNNKHGNDILGMDIKLLKLACPVISISVAYVVN